MMILAFDCAGGGCSAGLWVDGEQLAAESEMLDRGQAAALMPMIERVLFAASAELTMVDRIATTVGPGSFTGLRIGLASAIGLEVATGAVIHGVNSFDATATRLGGSHAVDILAIESKRADLYLRAPALFKDDGCRHPADVAEMWEAIEGSRPVRLGGTGSPVLAAAFEDRGIGVETIGSAGFDAADIAAAAFADLRAGRVGLPAKPVYLRPPDVTPARVRPQGPRGLVPDSKPVGTA